MKATKARRVRVAAIMTITAARAVFAGTPTSAEELLLLQK